MRLLQKISAARGLTKYTQQVPEVQGYRTRIRHEVDGLFFFTLLGQLIKHEQSNPTMNYKTFFYAIVVSIANCISPSW
jgi:hypothetical protein